MRLQGKCLTRNKELDDTFVSLPYPESHLDYRLTGLTPAVTVDDEATSQMKALC